MMKKITLSFLLIGTLAAFGQFHSLTIPALSPPVKVVQQIGVTEIEVEFHSPSVYGRDVWNDPNVIPQNGAPIPWRAGANENTTIRFSTDVTIDGQVLAAGKYGFHILPNGHKHTLLFASKDNLWGSYYLDMENDIVLSVSTQDTACAFSEHLDFEFYNRTDSSVTIALEWGDRRIPFAVGVDLKKTTIETFRYELNGENTYRWEAWNDAANWCLQHDTNLEEALSWVNRSINGGYGGFASNKNMSNITTKIRLLQVLNRTEEMDQTIQEGMELSYTIDEAHGFGSMLLELKRDEDALSFFNDGLSKYENDWGLQLFSAVSYYYQGKLKKALKYLDQCGLTCPDFFKPRIEVIKGEMKEGKYAYRNRN